MTANPGPPPGSKAVLVGVSAYEHSEFPPIRAARNSLQAMRELLCNSTLCGWPPECVTVLANPLSAVDLAGQIADLAETATGVLLVYYVGHGVLTPRGELCLTVTSTRPDRPKITGLPWEVLAELLRGSPAGARIVILDCCFAGQAIEALTEGGGPGLADLAHVQGAYTLTATTRNRTAHVLPSDQQESACTSFTGELRDLLRVGIPGKSTPLTLGDIYPVLRARLKAKGLPVPNQRGTDTAGYFPFAANPAAHGGGIHVPDDDAPRTGSPAIRVAPMAPIANPSRVDHAIRIACSIHNQEQRVATLFELAIAAPDRAERILEHLPTKRHALLYMALAGEAEPAHAQQLIAQAESLGIQYSDDSPVARTLLKLARLLINEDPQRAIGFIGRALRVSPDLEHGYLDANDLVELAAHVAAVSDTHADLLLDRAVQLFLARDDLSWGIVALARSAGMLAAVDPGRAGWLMSHVERAARKLAPDPQYAFRLPQALVEIANAGRAADQQCAERLINLAEHTALGITDSSERDWALTWTAREVAEVDQNRAEKMIEKISQRFVRAAAWPLAINAAVSVGAPYASNMVDMAERAVGPVAAAELDTRRGAFARAIHKALARIAAWPTADTHDLARIAEATAGLDPRRAEDIAMRITGRQDRSKALVGMAGQVAVTSPDHARRWLGAAYKLALAAETLDTEPLLLLGTIAASAASIDPVLAKQVAWDIADASSKVESPRRWLLAHVAKDLAIVDPQLTIRLIDLAEAQKERLDADHRVCIAEAIIGVVSTPWANSDSERAKIMVHRAQQSIHTVRSAKDNERLWRSLATTLAKLRPDSAEQLVEQFHGRDRDQLLYVIAEALADTEPERAERIARAITEDELSGEALGKVAISIVKRSGDAAASPAEERRGGASRLGPLL